LGGLIGGADHTGKDTPDLSLYRLLQIAYDTSFKQTEESAKRVIIFFPSKKYNVLRTGVER